MRSTFCTRSCVVMAAFGIAYSSIAQAPTPGTETPKTGQRESNLTRLNPTNAVTASPPLPSVQKSPVEFFRELLAMEPAERTAALADRSPETRKLILAKVRQYESLNGNEQVLRLQVTELRWYLLPLMKVSRTNRLDLLAIIPPDYRKLVDDRLREWDKLPAASQKELIDNEATMRYLTELEGATEEARRKTLATLSPARRDMLLAGLDHWGSMSESQRQKITSGFNKFFELSPQEKDRALNALSEPERRQMEKTLRNFSSLSASQRSQCIRSFEKFASLDLAERQQFLKNAERWKLMTPTERQSWRQLVNQLPLMPTEAELPPHPGSAPLPPRAHPLATNTN